MKRAVISTIAICLIATLTVPTASAAVKPGTACKKLGASSTAAGIKYKCVKSGKKLIWNKGRPIKKAAPVVVTPSVANPAPAATPTPAPAPKELTPLEKMNFDLYQRYIQAEKKLSPSFNFVRCPNVDAVMADTVEKAFIDAYSFWAPVYRANSKVNWLLMSEKDWDCWYETTAVFEGPNSVSRSWNSWDKNSEIFGHCKVRANAFCGYGTGVRSEGRFAQYNLIGSDYKIAPTPLTVHHEIVHIYQAQLVSDNYKTSKVDSLACWFMEGQANLFGVPIAYKGDPAVHRNFEKGRLLSVYPQGSSYSKEQWLAVLNDLQSNQSSFCFENELGYSLGWFALEWTYMNYSVEQMHSFLELIAKGSTWKEAIETIMKMDEQAYFGKIAQYLADEL
jgi:hypothetical protein